MSSSFAPGSPQFSPVALLGVGYMGGSLALALRRAGLATHVVGFDPSAAALETARARGIIDAAAAEPEAAVTGARLVLLTGPVRSIAPLAARIGPVLDPEALVIDIGSVKGSVVAAVESTSVAGQYVGCHPLAGTEASGPQAADARLYEGKPCYLCPSPATRPEALRAAEGLWRAIGASVLTLDPTEHDAFMAAGSHLPHVAAFCLAASLAEHADMLVLRIPPSYPPTSLRDTTRVAASNPTVWRDILLENRAQLLPLVRGLEAQVAEVRRALEADDARALEGLLTQGRACRRRLVPEGSTP